MGRIITLTTDFGTQDGFVGVMKGVILGINPEVTLVDITHEIAPQNIAQGALLFTASVKYFPPDSIHLVVVDPGVGSARRPIAVQAGRALFVAPDNGVISQAIGATPARAVHLNRPEYWLPKPSNTFHGRDIFAPCAAHLSLGVSLEALGEPVEDWVRLSGTIAVRRADGAWDAQVNHIDRFGNVVINLAENALEGLDRRRIQVKIAGRTLQGLFNTYSDVAEGELLALVSSSGYLEIGARNASAAEKLGIRLGDHALIVP